MKKKNINLLLFEAEEDKSFKKIKKVIPLIAGAVLGIFIVVYIFSLAYIQFNINEFNRIRSDVDLLERKITLQKQTEAVYITTQAVLDLIKKVLDRDTKIIVTTIPELYNMDSSGSDMNSISINKEGQVGFSLITPNVSSLENFINELKRRENQGIFRQILAAGIVRERTGNYKLSITLLVNKKV